MMTSFMKWVRQCVIDGIHIYEGAPYDKPEEPTVEITIEKETRNKKATNVVEKENLI